MNEEVKHQLYGGEISDYSKQTKSNTPLMFDCGIDNDTSKDLERIYNTQVKGKPSIDTTGIYSSQGRPPIERDPHFDKIGNELTKTLNAIAQQLNLNPETSHTNTIHKATTLQPQTNNDIAAANNNVIQALKELKDLKAI